MRNWKFGVSSTDEAPESAPLLLKGNIVDNLQKAGELGYDAIEVHTREDIELDYNEILNRMKETKVRIAQIVTGRLNTEAMCSLMDDRPYVTEAAMKGMYQYIDMASALEADIVVGWVKGNVPVGKAPEKYLSRLAGNLHKLNDYGKEKNVKINLEVINHYEVNVFTKCEQLVDFLDKYKLDNCYVHLDTYHMNLEEDSFEKAIYIAGDKLGYFHIADNQRWYPGSGQIDFSAIFQALEKINYGGYITVECFCHGDGVYTARKAIEYLKRITKNITKISS